MTPRKKLSVAGVAAQVAKYKGNLAAVARAFGVARQNVHEFVRRHPELLGAVKDAKEAALDDAESALQKAVGRGEAWAVCFFLKTQGKARGYVERQEIAATVKAPEAELTDAELDAEITQRLADLERSDRRPAACGK